MSAPISDIVILVVLGRAKEPAAVHSRAPTSHLVVGVAKSQVEVINTGGDAVEYLVFVDVPK